MVCGSASVGQANFNLILEFIKSVYQGLTVSSDDARVGLVVFADGVAVPFNYRKYKNTVELDKAIGAVQYPGGAGNRIGRALRKARGRLMRKSSRRNTPQVLVVFVADKATDKVKKIAGILKKKVAIIPIGVGGNSDKRLVRTLASSAGSSMAGVDYPQLPAARQDVVDMINKGASKCNCLIFVFC